VNLRKDHYLFPSRPAGVARLMRCLMLVALWPGGVGLPPSVDAFRLFWETVGAGNGTAAGNSGVRSV
jgi:hypothetical protein